MALVIDSSSPATHVANDPTATNTCASFTPPDSPLLLGCWSGDSASTDPTQPAYSSSPAQTWAIPTGAWDHRASGTPTQNGQAAIGYAVVSGSPGATTVSVVNGVATQCGSALKVYVITGHDPVAPIGVSGGGRQAGGTTLIVTFTASIDGGQPFLVICDWNETSTATWAADTGCTILDKGDIVGEVSYAVVQRTDPDEVNGASTTIGVTGLVTGGQYHYAWAEVISLAAAQARSRSVVVDGSYAANW